MQPVRVSVPGERRQNRRDMVLPGILGMVPDDLDRDATGPVHERHPFEQAESRSGVLKAGSERRLACLAAIAAAAGSDFFDHVVHQSFKADGADDAPDVAQGQEQGVHTSFLGRPFSRGAGSCKSAPRPFVMGIDDSRSRRRERAPR